MTLRPCVDCGELAERGTRCLACRPPVDRPSSTAAGYDAAWTRLSRRARRLQPFCSDCGAVDDLTVDHSTQAWERHAAKLEITLDLVDVVCRACNSRRGPARPTPGRPASPGRRASVKALFESENASQLGDAS